MPRGRPRKDSQAMLMKSAEFIGWALGGLEREIAQTRDRLASLTEQASRLRARVGGSAGRAGRPPVAAASFDEPAVSGAPSIGRRRRRRKKMSAEARKRISERMTKLWAERRKKAARG